MWTWGYAEFGYAWDRNLTDEDGPYVELMVGAYTDNQPDFSWLQPYDTKTFSQYWYRISDFTASGQARPDRPAFRELISPRIARVLLLAVVLAVLQQWCGINVIFNYAQEIFAAAGYQASDILFNIVITGAVNVVFTLIALAAIDRYGRRFLLLTEVCGLTLIYTILGALYRLHVQGKPMLALVLAATACYAMSLAPATWVVISEIFPNRLRSSAVSVAVTSLWAACFLLTYTFPLLNAQLGAAGTFWTYAAVCLTRALFLYKRLPETKGKTL